MLNFCRGDMNVNNIRLHHFEGRAKIRVLNNTILCPMLFGVSLTARRVRTSTHAPLGLHPHDLRGRFGHFAKTKYNTTVNPTWSVGCSQDEQDGVLTIRLASAGRLRYKDCLSHVTFDGRSHSIFWSQPGGSGVITLTPSYSPKAADMTKVICESIA